jgi:hypothetical protein
MLMSDCYIDSTHLTDQKYAFENSIVAAVLEGMDFQDSRACRDTFCRVKVTKRPFGEGHEQVRQDWQGLDTGPMSLQWCSSSSTLFIKWYESGYLIISIVWATVQGAAWSPEPRLLRHSSTMP